MWLFTMLAYCYCIEFQLVRLDINDDLNATCIAEFHWFSGSMSTPDHPPIKYDVGFRNAEPGNTHQHMPHFFCRLVPLCDIYILSGCVFCVVNCTGHNAKVFEDLCT